MHDLVPITALGGHAARIDVHGPVTLIEVPDAALASVAARLGTEAKTASALKKLLGAEMPAPGKALTQSPGAFWMGPDQWMVEAPFDTHEDIMPWIKNAVGTAASVTEQTDGWCRFDLTGSDLSDVFERLCPVNTRAQMAGDATRTTIDHLGCFVICRETGTHFSVIGPRSSATSLHHALLVAMQSAH